MMISWSTRCSMPLTMPKLNFCCPGATYRSLPGPPFGRRPQRAKFACCIGLRGGVRHADRLRLGANLCRPDFAELASAEERVRGCQTDRERHLPGGVARG